MPNKSTNGSKNTFQFRFRISAGFVVDCWIGKSVFVEVQLISGSGCELNGNYQLFCVCGRFPSWKKMSVCFCVHKLNMENESCRKKYLKNVRHSNCQFFFFQPLSASFSPKISRLTSFFNSSPEILFFYS